MNTMTIKEAYKILGVSKVNADREIKAKYKKLLILYHPDSDPSRKRNPEDDDKIRQVIEAYKKIKESASGPLNDDHDTYEFTWDAFENSKAFTARNIYFQFRIYDEELPLSKMARGKFVWDPDMEDFPLFSKSVLESCKQAIEDFNVIPTAEKIKNLFHLMLQEYVLPADAARKLGKLVEDKGDKELFSFNGLIRENPVNNIIKAGTNTSTTESYANSANLPLNIFLKKDRAVVEEMVTGRMLGSVSFDEDELYYVVLPLLEDPQVEAKATITRIDKGIRGKRSIHIEITLLIPKNLKDIPVSNANQIRQLLKES
ncbi:MAG: DnaJ domain-containing protein [Butyrivibrio sp.]|nr:DnaJ domain-containing protein [Butyrivibrio sp.]